eukprot:CAMPEP_0184868436 /NCGR_PEP_ID=MMETSP0580-20130426/30407_1 /TAXON_ID=1118495 /ORGANISM="Dactyliosolen fragilissimus" /LENGTH=181 /DNA_ID=CAMNT_0027369323 /DNA_START=441 /DNA_END=983 /DNA_ORIENTATION=+
MATEAFILKLVCDNEMANLNIQVLLHAYNNNSIRVTKRYSQVKYRREVTVEFKAELDGFFQIFRHDNTPSSSELWGRFNRSGQSQRLTFLHIHTTQNDNHQNNYTNTSDGEENENQHQGSESNADRETNRDNHNNSEPNLHGNNNNDQDNNHSDEQQSIQNDFDNRNNTQNDEHHQSNNHN